MKRTALILALALLAGCRFETREQAARHAAGAQVADIDGMASEAARTLPAALAGKAVAFQTGRTGDAALAVRFTGRVVAVSDGARARSLSIDTNGDGSTDAIVQLGPVVRGTALRDALGTHTFNDFDSQIEYARYARAINDRVVGQVRAAAAKVAAGSTVEVIGAYVPGADGPAFVTPAQVRPAA
jgi:predicted lipoprotein